MPFEEAKDSSYLLHLSHFSFMCISFFCGTLISKVLELQTFLKRFAILHTSALGFIGWSLEDEWRAIKAEAFSRTVGTSPDLWCTRQDLEL